MPNTLMTRATFGELERMRGAFTAGLHRRVSLCRVPGPRLRTEGGIYYVGMATRGDYVGGPTFDAPLRLAAEVGVRNRSHAGSPLLQFLDGLT